MSTQETRAILALLRAAPGPWVLATLVEVEGSSYRRTGARLLLAQDGRRAGSISGGCLEDDILERARRVQSAGVPETVVYDTTGENDLVWGVGLGCHGVVRVLLERLTDFPAWADTLETNLDTLRPTELSVVWGGGDPTRWGTRLGGGEEPSAPGSAAVPLRRFRQTVPAPVRLVVCGAGDDAVPLTRLGHELGWHVTVCDPRAAYATRERFPTAEAVFAAAPAEIARRIEPNEGTAVVLMTHHYHFDLPLLRDFLPHRLAYLGLLGPRRRAEKILADLEKAGVPVPADRRARLHAPVGLDLGSDHPEEVALSIAAEIQSVLAGRDARPLRERVRPIHGSP